MAVFYCVALTVQPVSLSLYSLTLTRLAIPDRVAGSALCPPNYPLLLTAQFLTIALRSTILFQIAFSPLSALGRLAGSASLSLISLIEASR